MYIETMKKIVKETDTIFFDEKLRQDVMEKGVSDYVTRADIEISAYLHRRLLEEYPEMGFVSEEEELTAFDADNKAYWILDPIDGTTNFIHQMKMSAVSLGLCMNDEVVAGVIYNPYTGEMFWAEKGKGAYLNETPICCSNNAQLSECLGIVDYNPYHKEDYLEAFRLCYEVYTNCQDVRTLGSAAMEMAYIACGRADVFIGRYLKPWDYAAGLLIVREAGGIVNGIHHRISLKEMNTHIIAANSLVYEEFSKIISPKYKKI